VQIVPLRFLSYKYKKERSVAFKLRQNPFSVGALPRTPLEKLTTLPQTPSRLKRGHPHHTPPHSAPTHLRRSPCVPLRISARSPPMIANVRCFLPLLFSNLETSAIDLKLLTRCVESSQFQLLLFRLVTIHAFDRQTDGQTARRTELSSLDRVCIPFHAARYNNR